MQQGILEAVSLLQFHFERFIDASGRDLLKRHSAGHSHSQDGKRKRTSSYSKNGRVSQACKACATSKLKCDEEKPCRRCRDRKLFCDYNDAGVSDAPELAEQQGMFSLSLFDLY